MASIPSISHPQTDRSQDSTTLAMLPPELFLRVFSEVRDKRTLCELRLVCSLFNEFVKGRVVERLIVTRERLASFKKLVSWPNTFDEACRTLYLEGFDYTQSTHQGWRVLASLIRKMANIHTIEWVTRRSLDGQVMDAISQLPALQNLHLTFTFHGPPENLERLKLPRSTLYQMKSVCIHFHCLLYEVTTPWQLADARSVFHHLIANSPALEHLEVGPPPCSRPIRGISLDLDSLFQDLQAQPNFTPSLQSFNPGAIKLPGRNAMGFFKQLSYLSLDITDNFVGDEPWSSLRNDGTKLLIIKVKILTEALVKDYLPTYRGLRAFHVHDISMRKVADRVPDDMLLHLLTHALPEHSDTLSDVRFCPSQESNADTVWPTPFLFWNIRGLLRYLQPIYGLERLDLIHDTKDISDRIKDAELDASLNAIVAHSPRLRTIYLRVISRPKARSLLDRIVQVPLHQPVPSWRHLHLVIGFATRQCLSVDGFPDRLHTFAYQLVHREEEGVFRLAPDLAATELLNEHKWGSGDEVSL